MLENIHPKYSMSVKPKAGKPYNPVHDDVDNNIATVIDLTVGERGKLAFRDDSWSSGWNILNTSTLEDIVVDENGNITFTTRNTVYTLTKIS